VVRLDCGHDQVIDHDNVLHNNAVGSWLYSKIFYRNLLSHQLHNDSRTRLSAHPHGDSQNEEALQDLPYIEWPRLASFIRLSTRPSAITQGFFFGCHLHDHHFCFYIFAYKTPNWNSHTYIRLPRNHRVLYISHDNNNNKNHHLHPILSILSASPIQHFLFLVLSNKYTTCRILLPFYLY